MYLILTFDVESTAGVKEIAHALPKTLDILSSFPEIRATFNVAAHSVNINKKSVHEILDNGHEIAAHGYKHDMNWGYKNLKEQEELIVKAKDLLERELDIDIVGWATPRGNIHSANINLLRKHGFLYVRDRGIGDYNQFVKPVIYDNFVDLPRFGYDETGFLKDIGTNKEYRYAENWKREWISTYLISMFRYKKEIEKTYLVTNLHPAHIGTFSSIRESFIDFLEYISAQKDVTFLTAKDFCEKLVNREIVLKPQYYPKETPKKAEIMFIPSKFPQIGHLINPNGFTVCPQNSIYLGFKCILLKQLCRFKVLKIKNEYDKEVTFDFKKRYLISNEPIAPYSTSRIRFSTSRNIKKIKSLFKIKDKR